MKRSLAALIFFLCLGGAKAQHAGSVSLNVYGGYAFQDRVNLDNLRGYVNGAFEYGGGLEYFLQRKTSVELSYQRQDTHLPLYGADGEHLNSGRDKGSVNFILIAGTDYFENNSQPNTVPYAGAGVGLGVVSIKDGNTATKFAWNARLGVKIKTSSVVSLNLQAYIQSIISPVGNDFYLTAGGTVIAVTDYASLFQFGLGAVLSFNFKSKTK